MKSPMAALDTGGGVWKLKWRTGSYADAVRAVDAASAFSGEAPHGLCNGGSGRDTLLAACMYAGAGLFTVDWESAPASPSAACGAVAAAAGATEASSMSAAAAGAAGGDSANGSACSHCSCGSAALTSASVAHVAQYTGHGDGALLYGIEWMPPVLLLPPVPIMTAAGASAACEGSSAIAAASAEGGPGKSASISRLSGTDTVATCAFYHKSLHITQTSDWPAAPASA